MNNLNLKSRFALLLMVLIAPFAGVSAAGLIDAGHGTAAGANIGVTTDTSAQVGSSDNTKVNVRANANTHANASTSASTTNSNPQNNGSATVTTGRNGSVDVQAGNSGNVIHIDRSSDEVSTNLGANVSVDAVSTQSDLKAFVASEVRNDNNFNSIEIADDHTSIDYKQPARFLGFLPVSEDVTVTVNQDGTVDVRYPWYSFLTLTNRTDLETALKSEVQAYFAEHAYATASSTASTTISTTTPVSGNANMTGSVVLTPSVRASLIARIVAVLKAHLTNGSGIASSTQAQSNS